MVEAKPTLDRKAAEQINLNVLRRLDPQIEELLATAAHVALYDFDVPSRRWARKDVEGSLFLVKRRGSPRFQIIILNKKSADNYVEDIGGGFQCELNPPYLLYRNKTGDVVGIWFYEAAECTRMSDIITKISSTFAAPSDAAAGAAAAIPSSTITTTTSAPPRQVYYSAAPEFAAAEEDGGDADDGDDDDDGSNENDVFWDKQVTVSSEVNIPLLQSSSSSHHQQHQQQLVSSPPSASRNALAGLFAGLKVASVPSSSTYHTQSSSHPPAPPPSAATISSNGSVALLTPQFLLSNQQQVENQGARLLQSLRNSSQAVVVMENDGGVDGGGVDGIDDDDVGVAKVAALLKSLAENQVFCGELAKTMKQMGF